jgi:signal transduction histidine kinase
MQLFRKTIISYFAFSALLLLAAVPVFYYTLKSIVVNNADENLKAIKTRIMPQLLNAAANHPGGNLDFPEYNIIFQKESGDQKRDSVYNLYITGTAPGELLPGRAFASHFVINQEWYSVEIKTSMVDKIALIKRIVLLVVIVLFLLLLGLILINKILSKKIWLPFYNTLRHLHEYRVDKQGPLKLERASVTEFNDLNRAIEQLTERDKDAYASQKEFAENASHEMQSPLAVFQSKLELLMQTKPLNEEQTLLITDMANASKRMSRLNKSLILLTRIDNNQFLEKEFVSVKDVLQKLLQQYDFQVSRQSITVVFKGASDINIEANKTLIEILLSNLLSNAIRHNMQNGIIKIAIKDNDLVIQNTGKASPLNAEKMFQRFQKESADSNSIGLGLEIVKKICLLNHYHIEYLFTDQMHSFSVKF